jgi:hypothetical protein
LSAVPTLVAVFAPGVVSSRIVVALVCAVLRWVMMALYSKVASNVMSNILEPSGASGDSTLMVEMRVTTCGMFYFS